MDLEQEIQKISERNKKVELDKAWETSWARRLFIAGITYVVAFIWLVLLDESIPHLKALVPVGGYLLSTLSLPPLKRWWLEYKK
jgi:hypothetical protein